LLNELLLEFFTTGFERGALTAKKRAVPTWLLQARSYMEKNYKRSDLSIADVAQVSGYSTWYLQKQFKAHFAVTPKEYLHRFRMTVASRIISQTPSIKIESIVKDCGYRSRSLFNTMFKRYFGVPPSTFRAE